MLVWLASYPRSGNTFLRILLRSVFGVDTYSIYQDPHDIAADEETCHATGHVLLPDGWTPEGADEDRRLWLVKTHEHRRDGRRAIVVHRDGRNASLSYRDYIRNYHSPACSFAEVTLGQVPFGTWGKHCRSWMANLTPELLVFSFDELVGDPCAVAETLSAHLELPPQGDGIPSFDELQKRNPRFFHSGKERSWKRDLSLAERILFQAVQGKALDEMGYGADEEVATLLADEGNDDVTVLRPIYEALESLARRNDDLETALERTTTGFRLHVDALESSVSWRITEPLRWLKARSSKKR